MADLVATLDGEGVLPALAAPPDQEGSVHPEFVMLQHEPLTIFGIADDVVPVYEQCLRPGPVDVRHEPGLGVTVGQLSSDGSSDSSDGRSDSSDGSSDSSNSSSDSTCGAAPWAPGSSAPATWGRAGVN